MQCFILAGGFATRLWPLTEKRAKPLLPLAGVPLIEYLVRDVPEGIPITISTNAAFGEAFEIWKQTLDRRNIRILIEETRSDDAKLGALGATADWIHRHDINEDVLLLTGDNYCGFSMKNFIDARTPGIALLAAHDVGNLEEAKAFGTVIVGPPTPHSPLTAPHSLLPVIGFEEKPKEPKTTLASTGCTLLPASVLPIVMEHAIAHPDNVGGIFEELLKRSVPVECFTFTEPWFDVGSFEAYLEATRSLVGERVIEEDASEAEQCIFTGSVVLGPRSIVRRSELHDVVLFEDCVIEDCVLRNCIVDRGCTLKGADLSGKMLREGTRLIL